MDDVAVVVRQHLELDVPRPLQELLHVDLVVAEGRARLRPRDADGVQERRLAVHHAHAAAAAAARGLDDHRVADVAGDAQVLLRRHRPAARRSRARTARRDDFMTRIAETLSPMVRMVSALRADEDEAALLDALGEIRVLGQEAVAGMDRHRVGDLGGADDRRHVEIAPRRGRRPDAHRLVREQHVLQAVVGGGVHGDGLDAELAAGAQDAQRDLAAVGDDDLLEHGRGAYSTTNSGWPNSTGSPLRAMMEVMRAGLVGLDLVHHLHGLDDAQHLADLDLVADLDEGLGARRGRGIEGADHGRGDDVLVGLRLGGALAGAGGRRTPRPAASGTARAAGRRMGWPGGTVGAAGCPAPRRHAADAHRLFALLDLDLGDAGFLQQLDQFLDFSNVHAGNAPPGR